MPAAISGHSGCIRRHRLPAGRDDTIPAIPKYLLAEERQDRHLNHGGHAQPDYHHGIESGECQGLSN